MDPKKLYDFMFGMYDYADYLIENISPNNINNESYFMSLVYIEDMMDTYGRGLISKVAGDINPEDATSLNLAHSKIDNLRSKMRILKEEYGFEGVVAERSQSLIRNWDYSTA